jgi:hypothetical protein
VPVLVVDDDQGQSIEVATEEFSESHVAVDQAPESAAQIPVRLEEHSVPSAQETQALSREEVEAALAAPEVPTAVEEEEEEEEKQEQEEPAPSIWEAERASRTTRLSREEVEAALAHPRSDVPEADAPEDAVSETESAELPEHNEPSVELIVPDDWDPPEDVDRQIARFNAMQRVVYKTVRLEVGAGAANFVRSCSDSDSPEAVDPLEGAEMLADGSWDSESLRRAILQLRIENPWSEYQNLIEKEIQLLRGQIGDARALRLENEVRQADPGQSA